MYYSGQLCQFEGQNGGDFRSITNDVSIPLFHLKIGRSLAQFTTRESGSTICMAGAAKSGLMMDYLAFLRGKWAGM